MLSPVAVNAIQEPTRQLPFVVTFGRHGGGTSLSIFIVTSTSRQHRVWVSIHMATQAFLVRVQIRQYVTSAWFGSLDMPFTRLTLY